MKRTVVQTKALADSKPVMEAIARTCRAMGHKVYRWRKSLATKLPYHWWLKECDFAFVFNCNNPSCDRALATLRRTGAQLIFVELGWHPQKGTMQLDPDGINSQVSWANDPLTTVGLRPLGVRSDGDLLLLLQHETDSQIVIQSPWFDTMSEFVRFVAENSQLPVRVRAHPRFEPGGVRQLAEQLGCRWDTSANIAEAIQTAKAVACVNSSGAVECLTHRLPVLCFGHSIYRHEGAVYCLQRDPRRVAQVTGDLKRGRCELFTDRLEELLLRIGGKQWTLNQLPQRLPVFLDWVERRRGGDRRPEPELPMYQFIRSSDVTESPWTGVPLRTADLAEQKDRSPGSSATLNGSPK
ncbi:MAG: hypothetical protein IIA67_10985 [Planctomycetes bacterium]|nr:hypothetical protein [Planctomycetota bacterium]